MDLWLKFYPKDWNGDSRLRRCSLAARGLWASCFEPMHEAIPYGHLLLDGKVPTYEELAVIASCKPREVDYCLKELISMGVASVRADGVIFSRRMVRDAEREAKRKQDGAKGGHPLLVPASKPEVNHHVNQRLAPIASGVLVSGIEALEKEKDVPLDEAWSRFLATYPQNRIQQGRPVQDGFVAACREVTVAGVFAKLEGHIRSAQWKLGKVPSMGRYFGEDQLWRQALPERDPSEKAPERAVGYRGVQPMGITEIRK